MGESHYRIRAQQKSDLRSKWCVKIKEIYQYPFPLDVYRAAECIQVEGFQMSNDKMSDKCYKPVDQVQTYNTAAEGCTNLTRNGHLAFPLSHSSKTFACRLITFAALLSVGGQKTPEKCFPLDRFREGRLLGCVLRKLEKVGPLSCVKECLLRQSCFSINYDIQALTCEINYANLGSCGYSLKDSDGYLYIEKRDMQHMVRISPCKTTTCGENQRCEILASGLFLCSITECSAEKINGHKAHRQVSHQTLSVGEHFSYHCDHNVRHKVTYQCQQDGTWRSFNKSLQRCECLRNEGYVYSEKENGCYRFFKEQKTHNEAVKHCNSTLSNSHLFLGESSEKIQAVINDVIPKFYEQQFVWIDGFYNKRNKNILTYKGQFGVGQFEEIPEYKSVDFHLSGCLSLFPHKLPGHHEVFIKTECSSKFYFICEIAMVSEVS
ncbi:uncharacterized protein LOC134237885 [Saccostrea cucullata]|uniref:uncharacterized protein LOC134237885 n=1 Tax=Saccostrea cuccullata TaxID=36930 RepID=UPI002ED50F56